MDIQQAYRRIPDDLRDIKKEIFEGDRKMKQILLIAMIIGFASCSGYPIKRGNNYTTVDKVHRCVVRLVERNGVNPTEAEQVCTNIFRRNIDKIGVHKQ